MKLNKNMKTLLEEYSISLSDFIPDSNAYPIWCKTDVAGRPYWGVSSFCGLDQCPIYSNQNLSQLEWAGNEVNLEAHSEEEIVDILKDTIDILSFWKSELETRYPNTSFYLFASYDDGDMLILDEGEFPTKSVTMRFWADRGDETVINLSNFDSWDEPAIIEHIIASAPPNI